MTLGKLNASIGLLIAALVSTYIIYRLVEASAPLPTLVKVSNLGNADITINELRIGGHSGGTDAASLRPPGVCFIQASYHGVADLRCEYVCEGDVTPE